MLDQNKLEAAMNYNHKHEQDIVSICWPGHSLGLGVDTAEFAQLVAVCQDNNGHVDDGKLGPDTRDMFEKPHVGGNLYLSLLPLHGQASIDTNFVRFCQVQGLVGMAALEVCTYDGKHMSKRPTDFFGLDGSSFGFSHLAASSLQGFIKYLVTNDLELVSSCPHIEAALLKNLQSDSWRKANIKDSPHNGGIFANKEWRHLMMWLANQDKALAHQRKYWASTIYKDGLAAAKEIGLKSYRGVITCVRMRNSAAGQLNATVKKSAKNKLKYSELDAINYLHKCYVEGKPNRQDRVDNLNKLSLDPVSDSDMEFSW